MSAENFHPQKNLSRRVLARSCELVANVTSGQNDPPVRVGTANPHYESPSPELSFLTSGELLKLVRGDIPKVSSIALSLLTGRRLDFTRDSERLATAIEPAVLLGTENIPVNDEPLIIAGNHPDIYDLVAGTIHITNAFSRVRNDNHTSGDIRWMIADAIPPRGVRQQRGYKTLYKAIDWGFSRLNHSYNFISTPTGRSGLRAFLDAKHHLLDTSGSQVIGMFPEGDITSGESLDEFHNGIGALATSTGAAVLPTGITRGEGNHLTIEFGQPVRQLDSTENAASLTSRVRASVSLLT